MQYTTTKRPMQLIATTIEEQLLSSAEYKMLQDATTAIDASQYLPAFPSDSDPAPASPPLPPS